MNISFNYKGKKVVVNNVKVCDSLLDRFNGLMFISKDKAQALLFDFKRPSKMSIHSLFVRFPFIGIWLDNKNNVLDVRVVKPWTLHIRPKKFFSKILEIPLNKNYRGVVKILVDRERFK